MACDRNKYITSTDTSRSTATTTSAGSGSRLSVIDNDWELTDPTPDIHGLFIEFDKTFFWKSLGAVSVEWSPRMTSCAGVCTFASNSGFTVIRLSKPLLSLRPRKDLVETLLHEMIHAYLFVTNNYRDRDDHGEKFCGHMRRINALGKCNITIYHTFGAEVSHYQTHWWQCDGPCRHKHPYYGMVKRSMNRAPGPSDIWWKEHQTNCGGTYTKVKEPADYKQKKTKKQKLQETNRSITDYMNTDVKSGSKSSSVTTSTNNSLFDKSKGNMLGGDTSKQPLVRILPGFGAVPLISSKPSHKAPVKSTVKNHPTSTVKNLPASTVSQPSDNLISANKRSQTAIIILSSDSEDDDIPLLPTRHTKQENSKEAMTIEPVLQTCACPICGTPVTMARINDHIDSGCTH